MPFNGSGTFTIVNTFIPNTTILSSAVNGNFSDIATGLSNCLTRDGQAGMTAAFKAIAGTAGAPSITFTSDATTGMYLISSGNLGISANGALGLEINQFQVAQFQQIAEAKALCVVNTANVSTSPTINTIATAGTGAISIGTATSWPANGYLVAGSEIMSFTSTAAGLVINTRGDMGTTNVSHATGSTINFLYTSVAQNTLLLPARATASRPAGPAPGDFAYNSGSGGLEFWNGSSWVTTSQPQIQPQGYLSPTAGTPIITTDAVSQTSIFYNPYKGNVLPIPTNGVFTLQTFSTSQISLSASQTTAGIYDIYGFISTTNSALTFGISPSWAAGSGGSVAPGSCVRGTGAGGADVTRLNGVFVNTTTMTLLNGANSYSIATASGIFLGSIYIGATAGTVNLHRAFGQNRQWGVWNAFNRVPVYLKGGESTASWLLSTGTVFRAANATTANSLYLFSGLAEDVCQLESIVQITAETGSSTTTTVGIGINSSTTASGVTSILGIATQAIGINLAAKYMSTPLFGVNQAIAIEKGPSSGTATFLGTETSMMLKGIWAA